MQWRVGTLGLQTALYDYITRIADKEDVEQQPDLLRGSSFIVHKPRRIQVPVYITSAPPAALRQVTRLEARRGGEVAAFYEPDAKQKASPPQWECVLDLREHQLCAMFPHRRQAMGNLIDEVLMISTPSTVFQFTARPRPSSTLRLSLDKAGLGADILHGAVARVQRFASSIGASEAGTPEPAVHDLVIPAGRDFTASLDVEPGRYRIQAFLPFGPGAPGGSRSPRR